MYERYTCWSCLFLHVLGDIDGVHETLDSDEFRHIEKEKSSLAYDKISIDFPAAKDCMADTEENNFSMLPHWSSESVSISSLERKIGGKVVQTGTWWWFTGHTIIIYKN